MCIKKDLAQFLELLEKFSISSDVNGRRIVVESHYDCSNQISKH
jgi:hypothetical protein